MDIKTKDWIYKTIIEYGRCHNAIMQPNCNLEILNENNYNKSDFLDEEAKNFIWITLSKQPLIADKEHIDIYVLKSDEKILIYIAKKENSGNYLLFEVEKNNNDEYAIIDLLVCPDQFVNNISQKVKGIDVFYLNMMGKNKEKKIKTKFIIFNDLSPLNIKNILGNDIKQKENVNFKYNTIAYENELEEDNPISIIRNSFTKEECTINGADIEKALSYFKSDKELDEFMLKAIKEEEEKKGKILTEEDRKNLENMSKMISSLEEDIEKQEDIANNLLN